MTMRAEFCDQVGPEKARAAREKDSHVQAGRRRRSATGQKLLRDALEPADDLVVLVVLR